MKPAVKYVRYFTNTVQVPVPYCSLLCAFIIVPCCPVPATTRTRCRNLKSGVIILPPLLWAVEAIPHPVPTAAPHCTQYASADCDCARYHVSLHIANISACYPQPTGTIGLHMATYFTSQKYHICILPIGTTGPYTALQASTSARICNMLAGRNIFMPYMHAYGYLQPRAN
jgi:hypothetical protein